VRDADRIPTIGTVTAQTIVVDLARSTILARPCVSFTFTLLRDRVGAAHEREKRKHQQEAATHLPRIRQGHDQ
jgi:hypothetical protein